MRRLKAPKPRKLHLQFGSTFLFTELHYEADDHYGTAKPLGEMCAAGQFANEKAELEWLKQMWLEYGREIELENLEQEAKDIDMPDNVLESNRQHINKCWDKREEVLRKREAGADADS